MKLMQLARACVLAASLLTPAVVQAAETPGSVIHVITLRYKDGTTEAQIQQVGAALKEAAKSYPGLTRVWLRPIKVQGGPIGECADAKPITHVIVMEFASEQALKEYADSPAQKTFYKAYLPVRFESRTHDITN